MKIRVGESYMVEELPVGAGRSGTGKVNVHQIWREHGQIYITGTDNSINVGYTVLGEQFKAAIARRCERMEREQLQREMLREVEL
jgi:hypothetical protein